MLKLSPPVSPRNRIIRSVRTKRVSHQASPKCCFSSGPRSWSSGYDRRLPSDGPGERILILVLVSSSEVVISKKQVMARNKLEFSSIFLTHWRYPRLEYIFVVETQKWREENLVSVAVRECNWLAPKVLILAIRVQVPVEPFF